MRVKAYLEITMKISDKNRAAAGKVIQIIALHFLITYLVLLLKNF